MSKYPAGTTVRVYNGSKLVEKFALRQDMRCLSSVRKLVHRLYPDIDNTNLNIVMG